MKYTIVRVITKSFYGVVATYVRTILTVSYTEHKWIGFVLIDVLNVPGLVLLLRPREHVLIILKVIPLSSRNLGLILGRFPFPTYSDGSTIRTFSVTERVSVSKSF